MTGPRPTLAFVLPSFAGGGAERVTLSLLNSIDRSRFEPVMIVMNGRGPLVDTVPRGVSVIDLGMARLRRAWPPLIRELRHRHPSAIIASHGYVNLALIAARPVLAKDVRLILREANLPSLSLPNAPHPRILALGYRWLYRHADHIVASSSRMAAELNGDFHVPTDRITLLANPVDVEALRSAAATPRRHGGDGQRYVAAGRLTRQKGFDRLLDRIAEMPLSSHVTILGDGPEQISLSAQATRLGIGDRVTFRGFEPMPWPWYAGADAFLLPSRWEGMSNAALEALACGTPVIATPQSGGIEELANETSPGAVTITEFNDQFVIEMRRSTPHAAPEKPRSSLLPARYDSRLVGDAFATLVAKVIGPCAA